MLRKGYKTMLSPWVWQGEAGGEQQSGSNGTGNQGETNNEPNLNPFAKPAYTENSGGPDAQSATGPQNAQSSGASGSQLTPQQQFASFVDGLNLTAGVDLNSVAEQIREGNTEALGDALKTVAAATFRESMVHANKLVQQRVDAAVKEAVKTSTQTVEGDFAFKSLVNNVPELGTEEMAPVAKAVLKGFRQQGQSAEDAVKNTAQYFEKQTKALSARFNMQSGNNNQQGVFSGSAGDGAQSQNDSGETEWLDLLAGENAEA